jgi:hypothetical protein
MGGNEMRVGNNHKGEIDGSIIEITKLELELLVKAIRLSDSNLFIPVSHKNKIDELGRQFNSMLQEMSKRKLPGSSYNELEE